MTTPTKEQLEHEQQYWLKEIQLSQPEPPMVLYAALGEVVVALHQLEASNE